MKEGEEETEFVTPGEVLGKFSDLKVGKGAYVANNTVYASLSGFRSIIPPPSDSSDLVHSFTSVYCFFWVFFFARSFDFFPSLSLSSLLVVIAIVWSCDVGRFNI